MSDVKIWRVAAAGYGVFYFLLASLMEGHNIANLYPPLYIAWSMAMQVCVVIGVLLFALGRYLRYARLWRWLFPIMIVEVCVGIFFDATVPTEVMPPDPGRFLNLAIGIWLMVPAYYMNFAVAWARPWEA